MDELTSKLLDSPIKTCAVSVAVASIGYLTTKVVQSIISGSRDSHLYPPGPPRHPLIGALRSFPMHHIPEGFSEWAELYGDIVYAPLPGMPSVILNSHEIALELLSRKPHSTSGRRVGYLVYEMMGWHWGLTFNHATSRHANQRKMLRRGIGPQRIGTHDILIESEVAKLMPELETFQGNPNLIIQGVLGRIVTKATYGEKIWREMGDKLFHWNIEAMDQLTEAFFAIWLVDFFNFLRFVPDWIPGLRYKVIARESSHLTHQIRYQPYKRGIELHKSGLLGHCILNDLLEEFGDQEDVRDALAILFAAASDTTTGAVVGFIHSLFLHPEIAQRVYDEIQSVTHGQRLPAIADRPNLPFTEAVFRESVRIHPFIPLGIPHVNTQDEVVRGYFIPKGTMIHQNIKYMLNDPKIWGDPDVFRPERFFEESTSERPDPLNVMFGYGMRVCPGMYLGERAAFFLGVTISSLFKIMPLEGKEIPKLKDIEWNDTAIQQPIGFECRFVLRDEKARQLIKTVSLDE